MAIGPFTAAKFVCARGSWKVTNLSLQKILYIAHMFHLGRTKARLINSTFEAWDYGPVMPVLYHKVKMFGDEPIEDVFYSAQALGPSAERDILEEACDHLLTKRPGELVAMTHWERGAWAKNYMPGIRGIVIPDTDIIGEYADRLTAK